MTMLLRCSADDVTGATDLASMLVRGGMRTIQTIGVPSAAAAEVDAVVVALKTAPSPAKKRSHNPSPRENGSKPMVRNEFSAQQIYFRYCSTFDSSPSSPKRR